MTPEHVELEYHEVADLRGLDSLPSCDLAAISTYTAQVKDAYELARRYRDVGVKTVIGGLHVTACPHEALRHCDAVVVGEGVSSSTQPRARSPGSNPPHTSTWRFGSGIASARKRRACRSPARVRTSRAGSCR
jgi:hypothetical protein